MKKNCIKGRCYNISLNGKKAFLGWFLIISDNGQEYLVERNGTMSCGCFRKVYQTAYSFIPHTEFLNKSNRGSYDEVLPISQIAFQQGYDYEVGVTLKINDESTVDFDKESTWFSPEDAIYIVKPKVSGKHLNEMVPIYERLLDQGFDVTFDIKPSSAETDDDFSKQLSAYPEGTEITMVLSDAEY